MSIVRRKDRGPLGSDEVAMWNSLVPHLIRAVAVQGELIETRTRNLVLKSYFEGFPAGVLLTNEKGVVMESNQKARDLLSHGDGLALVQGHLNASTREFSERLMPLLHAAGDVTRSVPTSPQRLVIKNGTGGNPLLVVISPLRTGKLESIASTQPTVLVQMIDGRARKTLDPSVLQALFNLTPSECVVCERLAQGMTIGEIAGTLALPPEKVNSDLQGALDKTQTRHEIELVALVLDLAQQSAI
jgi:DNA-binding CsgD family transcriptional regulator